MKFTDDLQVIAQYSETSSEGDSSSNGNEETRIPSNMGNDKLMEVIALPGCDEDSGATIPAESAGFYYSRWLESSTHRFDAET